jgi:putative endonuclease
MREYYVYIMTNQSRTLYIGVTNDLKRRVYEHKHKLVSGFTQKYNLTLLAYYESTPDVRSAIEREKQLKGWLRAKKIALIESANPEWRDLSAGWIEG